MSAKQSRFWNEKLGFLTINRISFRLSNAHTLGHFRLIKNLWNFKFKLPDFILMKHFDFVCLALTSWFRVVSLLFCFQFHFRLAFSLELFSSYWGNQIDFNPIQKTFLHISIENKFSNIFLL